MTTTVTAADNAPKVLISQSGRKGDPGTNGTNGDGFNQVRKSLLDNPLCHLFKTNKLVDTSAPTSTDSDITFTRASTATYVDRYGIVKTAAVDTIREEKDGFLIEGAGTNLTTYSQAFDNAAWVKVAATVITNNRTAPDGTISGERITPDGTTAIHGMYQAHTVSPSTTYTYSVFAEAGNEGEFLIYEGALTGSTGTFNLLLKTATTTQTGVTATIKELDSGWFRCTMTYTTGAAQTSARFYNILGSTLGGVASTNFMWFWGAQIEQSTSATSYIPTVATPVTRIADKAFLPVLNNGVTKEFSIFGIISNISGTTAGNKFIFRFPVVSGFLALFFNPNNKERLFFRYDDDSAVAQPTVLSTGNIKYFVVTVDESNVTININGTESSVSKITDPSLLLANNVPFFGSTGGALSSGNIKDFKFYDFALNANEIEYLLP
jgi:hypothetical protein